MKTEQLAEGKNIANAAHEFEDFIPFQDKIKFMPGETEKKIEIQLVPKSNKSKSIDGIINKTADEGDGEIDDGMDEEMELMFTLKITGGEPDGLKISKKNVCIIKIAEA